MLQSKGDPKGVIKEALEVREKTSAIRAKLQNYSESLSDGNSGKRHEIELEIRDLGEALRESVGLREKATLSNAIDIQIVWGFPSPTMSGKRLLKWFNRRVVYKQLAIFSDMVTELKYYDHSSADMHKLILRSMGKQ